MCLVDKCNKDETKTLEKVQNELRLTSKHEWLHET